MSGPAILITAVEPTRRGRFALFGGGDYLFSIDAETMAKSRIEAGCELTGAELEDLRGQSDERRAKDKALDLLGIRDHGSEELYRKLCRTFDEPTSAAAVAEMQRLGLLDDAGYAARRASEWASHGKSRQEISARLAALGIDRETADRAVGDLEEDEEAQIEALIRRKYWARIESGEGRKVAAALIRRGFSPSDVRRAVARAGGDETESED